MSADSMPERLTTVHALAQLKKHDNAFIELFKHGSLVVEMFQPDKVDSQQPHTRDELYVIVSGTGWFVNGKSRQPFEAGEVLFVPAGVVHRFENFTDNFATWVIFYGPEGGEKNKLK